MSKKNQNKSRSNFPQTNTESTDMENQQNNEDTTSDQTEEVTETVTTESTETTAPVVTEVTETEQNTAAPRVEDKADQAPVIEEAIKEAVFSMPVDVKSSVESTETIKVTVTETSPVEETGFAAMVTEIKAEGSDSEKRLIAALENYITKMKPGQRVENNEGANYQYGLWLAIKNVAESSDDSEFRRLWNILLGYFNMHKDTVFGERHLFRFSEYWVRGEDELTGLQRILNLIKLTADPEERAKGLKQVNINLSLEKGLNDVARQRIVTFYA